MEGLPGSIFFPKAPFSSLQTVSVLAEHSVESFRGQGHLPVCCESTGTWQSPLTFSISLRAGWKWGLSVRQCSHASRASALCPISRSTFPFLKKACRAEKICGDYGTVTS